MNRHIYILSAICLACGTTLTAAAQDDGADEQQPKAVVKKAHRPNYPTQEVRGTVIDAATRQPLSGVLIKALGYDTYTAMTEDDGTFVLKLPTFATAVFVRTPQYLSQQVPLGATACIELLPDKYRSMYDESTDITATATADMANTTSQTIDTDIEATLGADVRAITRSGGPGYGAAMFVRGLSSLNANAQPLVVIDGVVQDMQYGRQALHSGDYTNLLLNLNPEDIEKVSVMKNATALYGAKGAAGVIVIETKRGRSMATRINANVGVGVQLVSRLPEMMDASQYRLYAAEMLGTYPNVNTLMDLSEMKFLSDDASKYYYNKYHSQTDWTDEVYHTALTQNYNINVQGGDNVGMYNLSLGYTDAKSTARENGFNRLNVRFNTDISILRKLSTRFDMSFTKINRNVFDNGAPEDVTTGTVSSPTFLALIKSPFLNPYSYNNVTHQLSATLSQADDFLTDLDPALTLGNPTALLANGKGINKNRVETTHFNVTIAPRLQFTPALSLTETFSYTFDRNSQRYYRPVGGMPTFLIDGIGTVQNKSQSMLNKQTSVVSDTRLQWTRQLSRHYVDAMLGMRFTSFDFDDNEPEGQYKSAGNDKTPNISSNMDFIDANGADDTWKNTTWYAQADYNYRQRYYAQLTLAMESSSRIGSEAKGMKLAGVRWGFFPSVQAGWVITNESWFPKTSGINYLLLKAGIDWSGNDDINPYAARTSFSATKYLWNASAAQLDNIGNKEITWEKTRKLNVGLRSHMLANRLSLEFDYFLNRTTDLLTLKQFSNPVAGINRYWSNGGSLENTGFELSLTAKPVVARNVTLELGASVGHYVNKVKSLPDDSRIYISGQKTAQGYTSSLYGTDNIATVVGQPVGMFYGYVAQGVFATDAEAAAAGQAGYLYLVDETGARQNFRAGDVRYADLNGDGQISEADKTIIGNPNPDIYGNIFANLTWKNLSLFVGLNYSLGNDIYNYQRYMLEGGSNFYNQTTAMTNRWKAEGQRTDMPRIAYGDPMGNARFSSRWVEDGSYLRLKTVRLTYKLPVSLSWLQGLTVWAEANTLLTLTHYLGSDPEMSVANNVLSQGIDAGNVAMGRAFTAGLKINL